MNSGLYSILNSYCYILSHIGPALSIRTLLKPGIRDIPAVKNYIKYRYDKKKKREKKKFVNIFQNIT